MRSSHKGRHTERKNYIIDPDDQILITGAAGFLGSRVVAKLLERGFQNVRCFARTPAKANGLEGLFRQYPSVRGEIALGNLVSREDCVAAMRDVKVIFHLAAGSGEKSFPNAFMNSVVTTRNLLEASMKHGCLVRFVNVSSFTVYSNAHKSPRGLLDESCPVEMHPEQRGDAYAFAKVKQDEIVTEYNRTFGIPHVIVRPGYVLGPGKLAISGRVGIDTFGMFLHMGGSNPIPFTYVDNCADAIVLAGLIQGIDGEVLNVVDDNLPSSRRFLSLYKKNVRDFKSLYVPSIASYILCYFWERYSNWSQGQLPLVFNRKRWHVDWKKTHYSNNKLKKLLGWVPEVSMSEGLQRYFDACRSSRQHA